MDYCFMRTDTGYDVIMLAVQSEQGHYDVYRLNDQLHSDTCLFKEDNPEKLRERVRSWCQEHLPDDMTMTSLSIKDNETSIFKKIKAFLLEKEIPYEMKRSSVYISQKYYDRYRDDLLKLTVP
ncbi:hypothetical protein [Tuberibacillus sp. Marseille-P3662]|uniref:hypothetical protein n=1 Tax=Tuberibacillus sp. Marseille-P3662 TaxID=1965358 RepID=UPI000A1CB0CF|nr:hypothetical protein [Tuberibacillus sp. Marseille-P3662]